MVGAAAIQQLCLRCRHDVSVHSILAAGWLYAAQHNKDTHNNKPKWGIANGRLSYVYCSCFVDWSTAMHFDLQIYKNGQIYSYNIITNSILPG
jgi:hypothetical protein